jgi:hypothetical protein
MRWLGEKASVVVWSTEHHNPHDWDESMPCAKPATCTVWFYAWCDAEALVNGDTSDIYRLPTATHPVDTLAARLGKW